MVKMSPLQSYSLEVVPDNPEIAVIGAAASALLAPAAVRSGFSLTLLDP